MHPCLNYLQVLFMATRNFNCFWGDKEHQLDLYPDAPKLEEKVFSGSLNGRSYSLRIHFQEFCAGLSCNVESVEELKNFYSVT